MPFVNANFSGTQYHRDFANLVCETCGRTFDAHYRLECPNPYKNPWARSPKIPTICEKVKTMYERQPYYKRIHHVV